MAFSTAAEVKANKEIERLALDQAEWADAEFDERIREGDVEIESCLISVGYDLVAIKALPAVPPLLNELSKQFARAAILRDLFTRGPVSTSEDRHEEIFKEFHERLERFKNGELPLADATGLEIVFTNKNDESIINTEDVPRALTMDEPESQSIDSEAYSDPEVIGGPDC